jgi:hypothetical protein
MVCVMVVSCGILALYFSWADNGLEVLQNSCVKKVVALISNIDR